MSPARADMLRIGEREREREGEGEGEEERERRERERLEEPAPINVCKGNKPSPVL